MFGVLSVFKDLMSSLRDGLLLMDGCVSGVSSNQDEFEHANTHTHTHINLTGCVFPALYTETWLSAVIRPGK